MDISKEIARINGAKSSLRTFLDNNGVTTTDDNSLDELVGILSNILINADKVDGWHLSVKDDGSAPESGITDTITLTYTAGG